MSGHHIDHTGLADPTRQRLQFRLLTLVALVGLSACLFGLWRALTVDRPARVAGVVTYQGQPLSSAIIQFDPLDPTGRKATGLVIDGLYVVKEGMLPGRYIASIRDNGSGIPAKYWQPRTSDLSVNILDAQASSFNFDLR